MKKRSWRPAFEQLEDRLVPTTWGVAWPNAGHLTLSFAPDGTSIDGYHSSLFQQLNALYSTVNWETEVLRAFQTWASYLNVNVGVAGDDGEAFGTAGPVQGDSSFGDIRIGAHHLGSSVGLSSPFDPAAGTRSGDVVIDPAQGLGMNGQGNYDLFTLALHEAGHVFGLNDTSSDTTSIMYTIYQGPRTAPSSSDIAALQALYGARVADSAANATFANAPTISLPDIQGSLATAGDADLYQYTLPSTANTTATFTVQTGGLSLLTPRVTVYDAQGNPLGTAATTSPLDGGTSVQVNNLVPGATYYIQVQGARTDVFGVGSYRLKIDSGAVSEQQIQSLDATYGNTNLLTAIQAGSNNTTLQTATNLNQSTFQQHPSFTFAATNSLTSNVPQSFYQATVPSNAANQAVTLLASVAPLPGSTALPHITVLDVNGYPVAADVLANQGGQCVVQVRNALPGTTYTLEVTGSSSSSSAGYLLGVSFRATPVNLSLVLSDALGQDGNQDVTTVTAQGAQVTHVVLAAGPTERSATTGVRAIIYQNNQAVFVLTALTGQTVSADVFLTAGNFQMTITGATADGSALLSLSYSLTCDTMTSPLDPIPINGNNTPPPPDQTLTGTQPTQIVSTDPNSNPFGPPPTVVPAS